MLRDYEPDSDDGETATYPFNEPSLPHSGGILFQQWVCDAYSRAEAQRLAWFSMNQDTLRADTYQGLVDAVNGPDFCFWCFPSRQKDNIACDLPWLAQSDAAKLFGRDEHRETLWKTGLLHHDDCQSFVDRSQGLIAGR